MLLRRRGRGTVPSLLLGMARTIDLGGVIAGQERAKRVRKRSSPRRSIASDWIQVGEDLRTAMNRADEGSRVDQGPNKSPDSSLPPATRE